MKTLIFDFDGVIGDTFGMVAEIMEKLSEEFGF
jgi:beta-phosphoglucomutase-like phosphatase (HAD superfamily)